MYFTVHLIVSIHKMVVIKFWSDHKIWAKPIKNISTIAQCHSCWASLPKYHIIYQCDKESLCHTSEWVSLDKDYCCDWHCSVSLSFVITQSWTVNLMYWVPVERGDGSLDSRSAVGINQTPYWQFIFNYQPLGSSCVLRTAYCVTRHVTGQAWIYLTTCGKFNALHICVAGRVHYGTCWLRFNPRWACDSDEILWDPLPHCS